MMIPVIVLVACLLGGGGQTTANDTEKATVRVAGLVNNAGPVDWTSGMTVADAIAKAGGMTNPTHDPEDRYLRSAITRTVDGRARRIRAHSKTSLRAGDELVVGRDLRHNR